MRIGGSSMVWYGDGIAWRSRRILRSQVKHLEALESKRHQISWLRNVESTRLDG